MPKPFTPTYIDKQQMRLALPLPAAGVWDAIGDVPTPLALFVGGAGKLTIEFTYTRGGAAGAFDFMVLAADTNPVLRWYQLALYEPGVVATGFDTQSKIQREYITYGATDAATEYFIHGPIKLVGAVEWVAILSRESGNAGAPGTLRTDISLGWK
jgi:hypothetical protein